MKLRNKKTGEIVYATMMASYGGGELQIRYYPVNNAENTHFKEYRSISELNEEWEDYEEPKVFWYINEFGTPTKADFVGRETLYDKCRKNFGNYFETKEEAEKAVKKLKAWKRLKDKGFRFIDHMDRDSGQGMTRYEWDGYVNGEDLDLLFGGGE